MAKTLHFDFLGRPALDGHDDYTSTPGTPDLSITRATLATDTDADGYVREYQSGEARFTGATFANNLFLQSEDLDTTWTIDSSGVTLADVTGSVTAPSSGPTNVWEVTQTATTTRHEITQSISSWNLGGGRGLISFYAKQSANVQYVRWITSTVADWFYWDIQNGTASTGSNTTTGGTPGIVSLGNGWYRCYIYGDYSSLSTLTGFLGVLVSEPGSRLSTEAGSTDNKAYLTGAMLEKNGAATTPSTYIKTTTAAASSLSGTSTKGLRVEEARTNICLQSEALDTWSAGGSTAVTANAAVSPDGSTTADELNTDALGGNGNALVDRSVTVGATTTYTFSGFFKANDVDWAYLLFWNLSDVTGIDAYYDLTNGVVGTVGAGVDSSGIESYGNGWYRCWLTFTTATDTSGTQRLQAAEADGDIVLTRDGARGVYAWGAQLEAGAFPTSYIPTTTGTVTRNAEQIRTADVAWSDRTQGTFYTKASSPVGAGSNFAIIAGISDSSSSDYVIMGRVGGQVRPYYVGQYNGAGQWNFSPAQDYYTANTVVNAAYAYATNDIAAYVAGDSIGTDTSTADLSTGTAWNEFEIGNLGYTPLYYWNGHIAEIAYWDERLDNGILSGLSDGSVTINQASAGLIDRRRRLLRRTQPERFRQWRNPRGPRY